MSSLLYLFRHGAAAPPGILAGSADYPLLPEGVEQMRRWAAALRHIRFQKAWCSPLTRSRQSAAIVLADSANAPRVTELPGLREIDLGHWEGKSKDFIKNAYPEEWAARGNDMARVAPMGGESFALLAERVLPAFTSLCAEAAAVASSLVVAHQAVNRVILAHLAQKNLGDILGIAQPHAALTILELDPATGAAALQASYACAEEYRPPAR